MQPLHAYSNSFPSDTSAVTVVVLVWLRVASLSLISTVIGAAASRCHWQRGLLSGMRECVQTVCFYT